MDVGTVFGMVMAASLGAGSTWWLMSHLQSRKPLNSDKDLLNGLPPDTQEPTLTEAPLEGLPAPTPKLPSSLIIQNSRGESALAITELPVALFDKVAENRQKPTKSVSRLTALLQAAPSTALAINGVPENVFEVAINGPLFNAKDAAGNVIQDTYRAMTGGGSHDIKEHALLTKPENLRNAMNAAAAWQVASVIVAQKHLADISQRLEGIETGIHRIEGKIDAKRQSILIGAIEHLREIAGSILAGEHTPALRQALEDHAKDMMAARNEVNLVLKQRIEALPDIKDPDTFGATGYAQTIRDEMQAVASHFREWLLCSRVRLQAWSLLTTLPGENNLKRERYIGIKNDLEQMTASGGLRSLFSRNIRNMIMRVHTTWRGQETMFQRRRELLEALESLEVELEQEFQAEKVMMEQGAALLADATQPTRLLVKVRQNKIIEFKHLAPNETPKLLDEQLQPSVFSAHTIQIVTTQPTPIDTAK